MTKEQYEKWSSPFRKKEKGEKILIWADRMITALIFLSYPVLLGCLAWEGLFLELRRCMLIPAASFFLVSFFRKVYSSKRPYEVWDIQPLLAKETKGKSFPSRHVFSAFLIGMTFFYIVRPLGILFGVLGSFLGYIRIAGGVHFPKDVLAGALLGLAFGLFYLLP